MYSGVPTSVRVNWRRMLRSGPPSTLPALSPMPERLGASAGTARKPASALCWLACDDISRGVSRLETPKSESMT